MSNVPWDWPASLVTRVVDGDSLVARLTRDVGFHGTLIFDQKLRLNRINAPAVKTSDGAAAKAFLTSMLEGVGPVSIQTVKPYKYGDEWMAEIELADGSNVSDVMVTTGHAVYWDGTGPRPADGLPAAGA
jgi:endonuclease YncB( thermonuclease family)